MSHDWDFCLLFSPFSTEPISLTKADCRFGTLWGEADLPRVVSFTSCIVIYIIQGERRDGLWCWGTAFLAEGKPSPKFFLSLQIKCLSKEMRPITINPSFSYTLSVKWKSFQCLPHYLLIIKGNEYIKVSILKGLLINFFTIFMHFLNCAARTAEFCYWKLNDRQSQSFCFSFKWLISYVWDEGVFLFINVPRAFCVRVWGKFMFTT